MSDTSEQDVRSIDLLIGWPESPKVMGFVAMQKDWKLIESGQGIEVGASGDATRLKSRRAWAKNFSNGLEMTHLTRNHLSTSPRGGHDPAN